MELVLVVQSEEGTCIQNRVKRKLAALDVRVFQGDDTRWREL